jgi:hypothetical protein
VEADTKTGARAVLWYEIGAFGLLIALSWADELLGLPARLFGGPHSPNIPEAVLESLAILAVAIPVTVRTRRVVKRLFYLEQFLQVCASCQKVQQGRHWIPIAEFFKQRFDATTSHGMCPECFAERSRLDGSV